MLATVQWDGGGDKTSWGDRFNWTDDQLPGPSDDVVVEASTATLVYAGELTTVNTLRLNAALNVVAGTLAVENGFELASGRTLRVAGTTEAPTFSSAGPTRVDGGSLTLVGAGTLDFSSLDTFKNGHLTIDGAGTVLAPRLTNIDNSRLTLRNGAQFTVSATGYSATAIPGNYTLFSVTGAGTRLDLSSVQSLNDRWDDGWGGTQVHTIEVRDGGHLNLSGLQTIAAPARGDDRLDLAVDASSTVDVSALKATTSSGGQVRFSYGASSAAFTALQSAENLSFSMATGATLSLPVLTNWDRGGINVPAGGTFQLPELRSASGVGLTIGAGGTLNAPKLVSFTGSRLDLGANQALNAPPFDDIDNSRFYLSGGAMLSVAAGSYSATALPGNYTLFSVTGAGTVLDLSSVRSLNDRWDDNWNGGQVHTIEVQNGGHLHLSGLQALIAPFRSEDCLDLLVDSTSTLDISALKATASSGGQVRFSYGASSVALAALQSAENLTVVMPTGGTLSLPVLTNWDRGGINVPAGGTFQLPELRSASGVGLTIGTGGTLNAPKLVSFTGSRLDLGANQALNAPPFDNIDNSRFYLSGGAMLSVAAGSYSATALPGNYTLFSVTDAGTVLDLSSVQSLNDRWDDNWNGGQVHTIEVQNGGHLNLSGLQALTAPSRSEDRLDLVVDSASTLDVSALKATTSFGGQVRFSYGAGSAALAALQSAENLSVVMPDGATLSVPVLTNWDRGGINVPAGGAFQLPELRSASGVGLTIGAGGTLNAPKLASFTNSRLDLGANQTLYAPPFGNIDDSRFFLSGGATLAVSAGSYAATNRSFTDTLFSVEDSGTVLDLSSVQSLNDRWDDNWSASQIHTIKVRNGGHLNLSGLQTITAPSRSEDRLELLVDSTSTLDVSALKATASSGGQVQLSYGASSAALASLQSAENLAVVITDGATLSLPVLTNWDRGEIRVPAGGIFHLPELGSASGVGLTIGAGGTLNAPQLVAFTNSRLDLGADQTLNAPPFGNIDNSRFFLSGGATLAVSAGSYSATGRASTETLFAATDAGTVLDLSSVQSLNDRWDDNWSGAQVHTIRASNEGRIDLSGVFSIEGPARSEDHLDIIAESGGTVDLSSLLRRSSNVRIVGITPPGGVPASVGESAAPGNESPPGETEPGETEPKPTFAAAGSGTGTVVRWSSDDSGNWDDAANWDVGRVPGRFDTVIIDRPAVEVVVTVSSGSWEVEGLQSSESFVIAGGSLTVHSDSFVSGGFQIASGATFRSVGPGVVFSATAGAAIDAAVVQALQGSTIHLPNATTFRNGTLTIEGPGTVTAPNLANIDNSRFILSGGAQFAAAVTSYSATARAANDTLFSVTGVGTLLDLSTVTSLNDRWDDNWSGAQTHTIQAVAGGRINLAGLQTITAPARSEDRLDITVESHGQIDLPNLTSTISSSGQVRFTADVPAYVLPQAQSLQNTTIALQVGGELQLPEVTSWSRGTIGVPVGGTFQLPKLASTDGVSVSLGHGGTLNAPLLLSFTNSQLTLGGNQTLNVPAFTSINDSRFYLSGGAQYAVAATAYAATARATNDTLFSATGVGTLLDLSTVTSLNDRWDDNWNGVQVHTIAALAGGRINLAGLQTITAPARSEDRLDITVESHGQIDLPNLTSTVSSSGQVRFAVDVPAYELPRLQTLQNTTFVLQVGGELQLPEVTSWNRGTLGVPVGGTFQLPKLASTDGVSVSLGYGGTLNAPLLLSFTNSQLTLGGNQTLNVPAFTNVNDSRFYLSGGAQYAVAATAYAATGRAANDTLFSVTGVGTLLDLSTVTSLNDRWDDNWGGAQVHTVEALAGGRINLAGLQTVTAPARSEDRLDITVKSGGQIDLPNLASTVSNSGQVRFTVDVPTYELPRVQTLQNATFALQVGGELQLPEVTSWSRGTIGVPVGGTFQLPKLASADGVSVSLGHGGTLNAPLLLSFTNSQLSLGGNQTLNVPAFTNINDSRFYLSGGAQYAVAATAYAATARAANDTLFSATGVGTRLDMSTVTSLNDRWDDNWNGAQVHTVEALAGGRINLAGLQTVTAPARSEDRLDITVKSGGQIDLPNLASTVSHSGQVRFTVDVPTYELPLAQTLQNTSFALQVGGSLQLPEVTSWSRGTIGVPVGGTFQLPKLSSADGVSVSLGHGGTLNAPLLLSFTNSQLTLGGNQTLNVPAFTNINDSRFHLSGGVQYTVAATAYAATARAVNDTLFSATGVGTLLDLSSVTSLNDRWNDNSSSTQVHTIQALAGGWMDLSGLQAITAPLRGEDRLDILADTTGRVELGDSATFQGGQFRFVSSYLGVLAGDLQLQSDAVVSATGTLTGNLTNAGTLRPGGSPGRFTVDGSYTQTPTGKLEVEIGGIEAGVSHDQLVVTGTATLDGTLQIIRYGGYLPGLGQEFLVVDAGTRTGEFFEVAGRAIGGGIKLEPLYDGTDVRLKAVADAGPKIIAVTPDHTTHGALTRFDVIFDEAIQLASFTADDIVLAGPRGAIAVANPTLVSGNRYRFTVDTQITPGVYTLAIGPNVTDTAGNAMDQDGDTVNGQSTDVFTTSLTITAVEDAVLFVNVDGSYDNDAWNFYQTLLTAGARAKWLNLNVDGQAAALLQQDAYDQVWVFDLSTAADNYVTDWAAIGAWFQADSERDIITDARVISSYWSGRWQNEGLRLTENYYRNLKTAGGGLLLGTDHNAFHGGINSINDAVQIARFSGLVNHSAIPVDPDHPLMNSPNNLGTQLYSDSSPGLAPYGAQPNGRILYGVAWYNHNPNAPGISSTIPGGPDTTRPFVLQFSPVGPGNHDVDRLTVSFSEAMDPSTFTSSDVSLTGPAGLVDPAAFEVQSESPHTFTVTIPAQSVEGSYQVQLGPDIRDLAGNLMATAYQATFTLDKTGPKVSGVDPSGEVLRTVSFVDVQFDSTIAPSTFTAADVSLNGPGGAIPISGPSSLGNNRYRISFAAQRANGQYTLTIGPNISDPAGNAMDQNGNGTAGEPVADRFTGSFTIALPDLVPVAGQALQFDDVDDYVEVPNTGGVFDLTDAWTLEAWVYPFDTSADSRTNPIIWKNARVDRNQDTFLLAMSDGQFVTGLEEYSPNIDGNNFRLSSNIHEAGRYYHVAGVYDGNELRIYVDGALEGSRTIGNVTAYTGPAALRIGNIQNSTHGNAGVFDGIIDEVRIWSIARSIEDIQQAMHRQLSGSEAGLVAAYDFDEGSGTTARDRSPRGLDGSLGGGTPSRAPLRVASTAPLPQAAQFSETIDVSWTVNNTGTAAAGGSWLDGVYLSADATWDSADILLASQPFTGSVNPGSSYMATAAVTLPLDNALSEGTYYILVRADDTRALEEANENNNVLARAITLTRPPLPDLTVSAVATTTPSPVLPGSTIEVCWTVANSGTVAAAGTWSERIYLSADGTVGDDVPIAQFTYSGPLAAGAVVPRLGTATIPAWGVGGDLYVVVVVDAADNVVEQSESNNGAISAATLFVPSVLTLTLPRTTVAENEANPVMRGVVKRSGDLSQPLLVNLDNPDPSELSVPSSVTIAAGQPSAQFEVHVLDDGLADGAQQVMLVASAPGYSSASGSVTVTDAFRPALTVDLAGLTEVAEGQAFPLTIRRNGLTGSSLTVSLRATLAGQLQLPETVLIAAGETAVTFDVTVVDDAIPEPDMVVQIVAFATGYTEGRSPLTVLDDDQPQLSLVLPANSISEGAGPAALQGTVRLAARSGADLVVKLFSSDTSEAIVPALVSIPAGQLEATFYVAAVDDTQVDGPQLVTLSAQGFASTCSCCVGPVSTEVVRQTLIVTDDDGPTLRVEVDQHLLPEGQAGATLGRVYRNTGTAGAIIVTLLSSDPTELSLPGSVVIPDGAEMSAPFAVDTLDDHVSDGPQEVTIRAQAADFADGTVRVTVTDIDVPDLVVTAVGGPTSVYTESYDQLTYTVTNRGLAAAVASNADPAQQFPGSWQDRVFLSDDPVIGNDLLVGTYTFTGTLPVDAVLGHYSRSVPFRAPWTPGEYWVVVQTDLGGTVTEGIESNNTTISSQPIQVRAAYTAQVQTPVERDVAGTPIPLSGRATNAATNGPMPYALVSIHIQVRGTHRVIAALADENGDFQATFRPLPGEGGRYEIAATHPGVQTPGAAQDSFVLIGMTADPQRPALPIDEGATGALTFQLENLSDEALTGLSVSVKSQPDNLQIVSSPTVPPTLPGSSKVPISLSVKALDSSLERGTIVLEFTSSEGATLQVPVDVAVKPLQARLVPLPGQVVAAALRGRRLAVEFTVTNHGAAASGPIEVRLPQLEWLSLATDAVMPSLAPGASAAVVLLLQPPVGAVLTAYTGELILGTGQRDFAVPFTFRVISEARGTLQVKAVDEAYFFTDEAPALAQAEVTVRDAVTRQVLVTATTDASGTVTFPDLPQAYYTVEVRASDHDTFTSTLFLEADQTNAVLAFLPRQTVRYIWNVTPVEIEDRYEITIETEFETNVPAPVVTVEPALIDMSDLLVVGQRMQVDLTLTNHGLIAALDTELYFGNHPEVRITPLVRYVGELPAKSSITVPVLIERVLPPAPAWSLAAASGSGICTIPAYTIYRYVCIDNRWVAVPIATIPPRDFACPPAGPGGGGGIGGWAGGGSGGSVRITPVAVETKSSCLPCFRQLVDLALCALPGLGNCVLDGALGCGIGDALDALEGKPSATTGDCLKDIAKGCITQFIPGWCWIENGYKLLDCMGAFGPPAGSGLSAAMAGGGSVLVPPGYPDIPLLEAVANADFDFGFTTNTLLREFYDWLARYRAMLEPYFYVYGDARWIFQDDPEGVRALLINFHEAITSASEEGIIISAAERTALTALAAAGGIEPTKATALADRWNRTQEYWAAGWATLDEVPSGYNTDFMDAQVWLEQWRAAEVARNQAKELGYSSILEAMNEVMADLREVALASDQTDGICARVRLQIKQEAVLTRDAFEASLELINTTDRSLTGVSVQIKVLDSSNRDVTDLFGIAEPTLSSFLPDGSQWQVQPHTNGRATWLIVPATDAATSAATQYFVTGTLRYVENGREFTVPLTPETITVYPQPELHLDYFHQRDVFSDDPWTDEVEPAQPFQLAVLVHNQGYGPARNLRIESAQPQIIDNEKGLLIDFKIIGTEVAGQNLTPSLTANFGHLDPGEIKIGRWYLTSTLQGQFIDYEATFRHLSSLGDERLSLIKSVAIHELIHTVEAYGSLSDGLPDFLVNELADPHDAPDTLYLSDGSVAIVQLAGAAQVDGPVTKTDLQVTLTVEMNPGWNYLRLQGADPGGSDYRVARVVRSDGVQLPAANFWQTDRTFIELGRRPLVEDSLHLLDLNASQGSYTYTLFYEKRDQVGPSVTSLESPPATTVSPVTSLAVTFSEEIEPTSFNWQDVALSRNNGPNLVTSAVTVQRIDAQTYRLDGLSGITAEDGQYVLTVSASEIRDLFDNAGSGLAVAAWAKAADVPGIADVQGVTAGFRNTPVSELTLSFTKPINPGSLTAADLRLTRDNVPLDLASLVKTQTGPQSFHFALPPALTSVEGTYLLTIDATGVQDLEGRSGIGEKTVVWVLDTTPPQIVSLSSPIGALTNRPVDGVELTLSEAVLEVRPSHFALVRDGGAKLLGAGATIQRLSDTRYRLVGLSSLTAADGAYRLSVDAALLQDPAGNAGSGVAELQWIMDGTPPSPAVNLAITPDTGLDATDGRTNVPAVQLSGDVAEPGVSVAIRDLTTGTEWGPAAVAGTHFTRDLVLTSAGRHQLRVRVTDAAGNFSDSFFDVFVDVVHPRVAAVAVAATPSQGLEVRFSEAMNVGVKVTDGSIAAATRLMNLSGAEVPLRADQFAYDPSTQTLGLTLDAPLAPGTYRLRFEGGALQDVAGNPLTGGGGGLQTLAQPAFGAEQLLVADGDWIQADAYSVPSLADWNDDGRLDLLVGEKTSESQGKVRVYLNTGSPTSPQYVYAGYAQTAAGDLVVPAAGCLGVFPRLFDWNRDGRPDLVLGLADGTIQVAFNEQTAAAPRFAVPVPVQVGPTGNKADVDVGDRATLDIVDWNGDGRFDLVTGALDGKVRVFLNAADSGPADLQTMLIVASAGNELVVPGGRASVAVGDLTGDGRWDLVVGNTEGQLYWYANRGTLSEPAFGSPELLTANGQIVDLAGTPRSRPYLGDADGDGQLDLLVGAFDGFVRFYRGRPEVATVSSAGSVGQPGDPYVYTFQIDSTRVVRLLPNPSGFVAEFNRPIQPALSLYDVEAIVYGAPDVTLVGDTVGLVSGSLVVDGARLSFVATAGPLAADSYTVQFRSAANAFRGSALADLLDGNADGTPGDAFTSRFVVSAPAPVVVGVPDFTRGPGQLVDVPATEFGLPLTVSEGAGITTLEVLLAYDPRLLSVRGARLGPQAPASASVQVDTSVPGELRLRFTSPTPLPAGAAQPVTIEATVPLSATYGAAHRLDLRELRVNEGRLAATADDAVHAVAYFGDTTGDQIYSGLDAQRIARVVVQLDSGFEAFPLIDPAVIADISSGGLTGIDAVLVAREVVGLDPPEIPPLPLAPQPGMAGGEGEWSGVWDEGTVSLAVGVFTAQAEPGDAGAVGIVTGNNGDPSPDVAPPRDGGSSHVALYFSAGQGSADALTFAARTAPRVPDAVTLPLTPQGTPTELRIRPEPIVRLSQTAVDEVFGLSDPELFDSASDAASTELRDGSLIKPVMA